MTSNNYNNKSPAVKRLMREARELSNATEEYFAHPLEENLFEWHFTIRGPCLTDFDGGLYHGRILLPSTYPMQPPYIIFMTPNGRFEVNKKICLSISGHHPETWQPSWSIRTALMALIAFMPTPGQGTIGALDYTPEERKALAKRSQEWVCSDCGLICDKLIKTLPNDNSNTELSINIHNKTYVQALGISENGDPPRVLQEEAARVLEQTNIEETSASKISLQFNLVIFALTVAIAVLLYRRLARLTLEEY